MSFHSGDAKTLVAAHPVWDVSTVPICPWGPGGFPGSCWPPGYVGILEKLVLRVGLECWSSRTDGLASESEYKQAEREILSSTPLHLGCHQKVPFRIRMDYSASNHPIKEIPHKNSPHLRFSLIPDAVRLTSKISYYRHLTCKVITKSVVE